MQVIRKEQIVEIQREVEVLVVGGGPAGIGASIAAARQGRKVLLLEKRGFLGGNITACYVEGCNYFTFNIPNTVCNDCGHIDKRYLKECPHCHSKNIDYVTRIIGYLKRVSNFSQARQQEAGRRYYAEKDRMVEA